MEKTEKPRFNITNRIAELKKIDVNLETSYEPQIKAIEEYIRANDSVLKNFDDGTNKELWEGLREMLNDFLAKLESDYENIESDH